MKDEPLKRKTELRRFRLKRNEDESGVSGTGYVAEGVKFSDGQCVINWLTDTRSIGLYHSPVEMIHIHGHGGKTIIEWVDEESVSGSGGAVKGTGGNKESKLVSDKSHTNGKNGVDKTKKNGKDKKHHQVVTKLKEILEEAVDEIIIVDDTDMEVIETTDK